MAAQKNQLHCWHCTSSSDDALACIARSPLDVLISEDDVCIAAAAIEKLKLEVVLQIAVLTVVVHARPCDRDHVADRVEVKRDRCAGN